jgi:hypothetical protein
MAGADTGPPTGYMPPVENGPVDPFLDHGVVPEGIGHPSDGADDAFRQLTTSDTDPFGTRSGSGALSGMAGRRGDQHDVDDEDRYDEPLEKKSRGFGDSTDPRLIVGAIGAGLAIVLLGGFALAAGTGGGNDDPAIAVTDPLSTEATSTTLSTSTTTEATTTSAPSTTSQPRTTTRPRTTTTRPRPTTTPSTEPPTTTPSTEPPTTTTQPTTTTTATTTTTTTTPP